MYMYNITMLNDVSLHTPIFRVQINACKAEIIPMHIMVKRTLYFFVLMQCLLVNYKDH